MIIFGKLLALSGIILLLGAWQLDLLFGLFDLDERLIEEGGTLHYRFHLERNRLIGIWVGGSALFLGSVLTLGARIIARNEAANARPR